MSEVDTTGVALAALAGVLVSSIYYPLFASHLAGISRVADAERPPLWKLAFEVVRNAILAVVFAAIAAEIGADTVIDGLLLGLCFWVGFPLILWTGAMLWERTPWKLAAIHGGDWLLKLLAMGAIIGCFQ